MQIPARTFLGISISYGTLPSTLGEEALAENWLAYACQIYEAFVSNPLYPEFFNRTRNFIGSARKIDDE